ncbi:MAG: DUF1801 domain-containing protein [Chthonomonas sp.]|nr:DUF1801 domain-containing protein [Chthonomonas sp.]
MTSDAKTVEEYLISLPEDRRVSMEAIRDVVRKNINPGFEEGMQYGAIGYFVPFSLYPAGYHCDKTQPLPFLGIASQKNHIGIYAFCLYINTEHQAQFIEEWKATGKKLDMGKACIRVKDSDGVAMDALASMLKKITVQGFVDVYTQLIPAKKRK